TGHQFPMYHLPGPIPAEFQTQGIPATFIISKARRVVVRHIGAADWAHDDVVSLLERLLHEEVRGSDSDNRPSSAGEAPPKIGVAGPGLPERLRAEDH